MTVAYLLRYSAFRVLAAAAAPSLRLSSEYSCTASSSNATSSTISRLSRGVGSSTYFYFRITFSVPRSSSKTGCAIGFKRGRCLPYTEAAQCIHFLFIILPNSSIPESSSTLSFDEPLTLPSCPPPTQPPHLLRWLLKDFFAIVYLTVRRDINRYQSRRFGMLEG